MNKFDIVLKDIQSNIKQNNKNVIVILGPTASGKTDLAHKIAIYLNSEIINADSRQIYKYLDILTAKPTKKQIKEIKYHLLDFLDLDQDFSAFEWKKRCIDIIDEMHKKNKIPIICGGTMLYIDTLIKNYDPPKIKQNKKIRVQLEKEYEMYGKEYMYEKLLKLDPNTYVHPNNKYHLLRNLEICLITNKPASELKKIKKPMYNFLIYGISVNKDDLKIRINKRTQKIFNDKSIKEFKNVLKKYDINILKKIIGAQEMYDFLNNKITKDQAIQLLNTKTIQYAKRQMTWWKKNKDIKWL